VREKLKNSRNEGVFTPPSLKGSIELPGHNGGANWGSSAINPARGTLFIVSKELPTFLQIVAPGAPAGRRGGARANAPAPGGPEAAGGRANAPAGRAAAPPAPAKIPGAPEGFVAYNSPYDFFNNY